MDIDFRVSAATCFFTYPRNSCSFLLSCFFQLFPERVFGVLPFFALGQKFSESLLKRRVLCEALFYDFPGQPFVMPVNSVSDLEDIPESRNIVCCVYGLFKAPRTEIRWWGGVK